VSSRAIRIALMFLEMISSWLTLILDQENEKYPVGFESQGIHDGLAE
jgi:hypothetical protein